MNTIAMQPITPHTIHIVSAVTANWSLCDAQTLLSPAERAYALAHPNNYNFPRARAILRQTLSHYLALPPTDIHFAYNPYGKPYIDPKLNPQSLSFNLSHSQHTLLIALTQRHEVGIDVEILRPLAYHKLAKRLFHPDDYHYLTQVDKTLQRMTFFKIFTAQEALIKAQGLGIFNPEFKRWPLHAHLDMPTLADNLAPTLPWQLHTLKQNTPWCASLAYQYPQPLDIQWISLPPTRDYLCDVKKYT